MFFKNFIFSLFFFLSTFCLLLPQEINRIVFQEIVIKGKETYEDLFGEDWKLVAYINRIDKKNLKPGTKLMVPMDLILARQGDNILSKNWEIAKKFIYQYPFFPRQLIQERSTPKLIAVILDEQYLGVYEYGSLKICYPISSGKASNVTVCGRFTIYSKSTNYISRDFGDSMPWALMFTRRGHAIHQGPLPGYPASHGCIRLFLDDAKHLYSWAEIGTVVLIKASLRDL